MSAEGAKSKRNSGEKRQKNLQLKTGDNLCVLSRGNFLT